MKQVVFGALMLAAFSFFAMTLRRYARVAMLGTKDPRPRFDQVMKRLAMVLIYFVGQKKVAERQVKPSPQAWHHLFIFWGFLIITIGTGEIMLNGVIPQFRLSLLLGDAVASGLWWLIDLLNLVVLTMIGYGFFRRIVLKPRLIPMNLDAGLILGGIGGLMISHFAYHGLTGGHAGPISKLVAGWFSTDATGANVAYWTHVTLLFAFLNYLPYSKHIHLLGALPNIATMNLSARKMDLPKLNLEDETQWGVGKYTDFSWKSLLDTYACTECARCSNYCPAYATDKPLSPMALIHDIRYEMLEKGPLLLELKQLEAAKAPEDQIAVAKKKIDDLPPLVGGRVLEETLWACTTCGACQEACPVFIEHPMKIIQMRQNLVLAQEKTPPDLARAFRNIERNSNPWGIGSDQRMDWAEGLSVPTIEDKPNPEYLLWVGCAGAFDQRIRKQTQAMVKILNAAGVDYAVLGHQESCTGDPARRGGNELLFQMQAEANVEVLNTAKVKKVITSCPHCLHTLRHDYPQFGGNYELIHHTQLVSHLLDTGKLKVEAKSEQKVADSVVYHDSCYLGRWNGEYEAPRNIIKKLPIAGQLMEPERNKAKGFCCGAGGGRMFMEEHTGTRINRNRTNELVATGAQTIAVACPFCNVMMTDGVKDLDKADSIRVLDVAELVAESLPAAAAPAPEAKAAE